jgi:hypothetical protein
VTEQRGVVREKDNVTDLILQISDLPAEWDWTCAASGLRALGVLDNLGHCRTRIPRNITLKTLFRLALNSGTAAESLPAPNYAGGRQSDELPIVSERAEFPRESRVICVALLQEF